MGTIFRGLATGFLAAIFVSIYAEGFFEYVLPWPIIYGILAPLFAAIAIFLLMLAEKEDKQISWTEEGKKGED